MSLHYVKSKRFIKSHNRGLALLSVLIVFSIVCLGFGYIIQTNSIVGYSYQIREQKEKLSELEKQGHDLEIEIARLQSPVNLERMIESLNLVDVGEVIYLESQKAMAAAKQ